MEKRNWLAAVPLALLLCLGLSQSTKAAPAEEHFVAADDDTSFHQSAPNLNDSDNNDSDFDNGQDFEEDLDAPDQPPGSTPSVSPDGNPSGNGSDDSTDQILNDGRDSEADAVNQN